MDADVDLLIDPSGNEFVPEISMAKYVDEDGWIEFSSDDILWTAGTWTVKYTIGFS